MSGPACAQRDAAPHARPGPGGAARPLLRALLRRALLRALRAPRLPHVPPLAGRTVPGATLSPLRWRGGRGQSLAAWLVVPDRPDPSGPGAPAVIALHGWGANASTMWPLVEPLVRAGLAVMLLDASCHGDSGEEAFTSLPRFAEDLADAAAVLAARPGVDARRIGLVGHSVGAAAALLHAAREGPDAGPDPRRPEVAAVVSLSAFSHPETVMRRWMAQRRLSAGRLAEAVVDEVQQVIGARFDGIAPLRTIGLARGRVMVVHGLDDATVPVEEARRLHRARPDAELLLVPGDHDLREALAPHAPRIVGFLAAALAEPPAAVDANHPNDQKPG